MIMQVPGDALALVTADVVDLILQFVRSRLDDAQRFSDEAILFDQSQAVAAQLVELLHGNALLPLRGQAPHPLRGRGKPCIEHWKQAQKERGRAASASGVSTLPKQR